MCDDNHKAGEWFDSCVRGEHSDAIRCVLNEASRHYARFVQR